MTSKASLCRRFQLKSFDRPVGRILAAFAVHTFLLAPCALADHYVAQNGQAPSGTFTTWATAASNIQDAVNVAYTNSTVWVGAGRFNASTSSVDYAGTNVVYINRALTLRSSNGVPGNAIIDGQGSNRGIAIVYSGSTTNLFVVNGFTISNCSANVTSALTSARCYGGGILFLPSSGVTWTGVVQNCVISGNSVGPGSVYDFGGGIFGGYTSGTRYFLLVTNCTIRGNRNFKGWGGGLYAGASGGTMVHSCLFENNSAISGGGCLGNYSTFINCIFQNNAATGTLSNVGGGGVKGGYNTFTNCLGFYNTAAYGGGFSWSDNNGPLYFYNCTIVSNRSLYGGGIRMDKAIDQLTVFNSIVYSNSTIDFSRGALFTNNISFSCFRTNGLDGTTLGTGNITSPPAFVDFAGQDFQLSLQSPCLNTGTNLDWMTNAVDLDGKARIRYGRADMGAYEHVYNGTIYKMR
ncbi:MAG: right-handed parallel beta-helix repeat-containing protein [Kiritimatiellia bacterium]